MSTWRAALRMSGVPPCCGVREVSWWGERERGGETYAEETAGA
jgi:hypothetical protein